MPICTMLTEHGMPLAPSTNYTLRKQSVSDADLTDAYAAHPLHGIWTANFEIYGVRKLWHDATPQGLVLGRD